MADRELLRMLNDSRIGLVFTALKNAGVALIGGGRPRAYGGTDSVNAGDSVVVVVVVEHTNGTCKGGDEEDGGEGANEQLGLRS
jgi:hypothetical protein